MVQKVTDPKAMKAALEGVFTRPDWVADDFKYTNVAWKGETAEIKAEALALLEQVLDLPPEVQARLAGEITVLRQVATTGKRAEGVNLETIRHAIQAAAEAVALAAAGGVLTSEQAVKRLDQLSQIIDSKREQLNAMGFRNDEFEEWLKKSKQELAQLQPGSKEYFAKQTEIAQREKEHFEEVRKQAEQQQKPAASQIAGEGLDHAKEKLRLAQEALLKKRAHDDISAGIPENGRASLARKDRSDLTAHGTLKTVQAIKVEIAITTEEAKSREGTMRPIGVAATNPSSTAQTTQETSIGNAEFAAILGGAEIAIERGNPANLPRAPRGTNGPQVT